MSQGSYSPISLKNISSPSNHSLSLEELRLDLTIVFRNVRANPQISIQFTTKKTLKHMCTNADRATIMSAILTFSFSSLSCNVDAVANKFSSFMIK